MKKKGSALVFSVLMLAFFLALSLNIYFLARKKAERAGVKVRGEKTTNNIDIASSLGYQELFLAQNFVRLGFLYTTEHDLIKDPSPFDNSSDTDDNIITLGSATYLRPSDGTYINKYAGIHLTNFIDYFTSHWEYSEGGENSQKLIVLETSEPNKNRMWQSAGIPQKAFPLWSYNFNNLPESKQFSIGGYSLTEISTGTQIHTGSRPQKWIMNKTDGNVNTKEFSAKYIKTIRLDASFDSDTIDRITSTFQITFTENFTITNTNKTSGSNSTTIGEFFDAVVVSSRSINDFSITILE